MLTFIHGIKCNCWGKEREKHRREEKQSTVEGKGREKGREEKKTKVLLEEGNVKKRKGREGNQSTLIIHARKPGHPLKIKGQKGLGE